MGKVCRYKGHLAFKVLDGLNSYEASWFGKEQKSNPVVIKLNGNLKLVDAHELIDMSEDYSEGYIYGMSKVQSGLELDDVLDNLTINSTEFVKGVTKAYKDNKPEEEELGIEI